MILDFAEAYRGKRVFVTGHTGFKGSWLSLWLSELGAVVSGLALEPPTSPNNYEVSRIRSRLTSEFTADVRNLDGLTAAVKASDPDIVFHLAAQPLVRESFRDPIGTLSTNVIGTANLLEAVRARNKPCAIVVVTSDKCYENAEWSWGYRETDPLGGHDPYSMSKGATELVVASWRRSFFPLAALEQHGVCVATARAGNVIGGGDWQLERILVDSLNSLEAGKQIEVRNPNARRPWQHVLEPLRGYLLLGARMLMGTKDDAKRLADAWNFGPDSTGCWTVGNLVNEVIKCWGTGSWRHVPDLASLHEAGTLSLCNDKAALMLDWRPVWDVHRAVSETVAWRRAFTQGADMNVVTTRQIAEYSAESEKNY